jgi:hypothetical protein
MHNDTTKLKTFTTSFATRFQNRPIEVENQYHVKNVWNYCTSEQIKGDIPIDTSHDDPVVEALRSDAAWLLKDSGLAVLAAGDIEVRARAAGLGASGDHMRERARAMASLMGVALPFIPERDSLTLLPESRSEDWESDIVRAAGETPQDGVRKKEPYRDFLGRLREDLDGISQSCSPLLASGKMVSDVRFHDESDNADPVARKESFLAARKEFPLLYSKTGPDTRAAMSALADLAAAFAPRPSGRPGLVVPPSLVHNLWSGSLSEVIRAFR